MEIIKYWIHPNLASIQKLVKYNFSNEIFVKEYGRYEVDITLSNESLLSGTVFTMDGKTPLSWCYGRASR